MLLYTLGHSNHPIERLLELLEDHDVKLLVDVRSTPFSRYNPQYNRNALEQALQSQGINYLYMGDVLGGRPNDPACYHSHTIPTKASDFIAEIDYPAVMEQPWFIQGIQRLVGLVDGQLTCILCSEKDPLRCHRHLLIARYMLAHTPEVTILHILADSHLVNAADLPGGDPPGNQEQLSFQA